MTIENNRALKQSGFHRSFTHLAAIALAVAGILFVMYPALRPFSDESTLSGAAAFASVNWITAHVLAMLGFILLTFGQLGLYAFLRGTNVGNLAFLGFILSLFGSGLTLPFYGAEAFGLQEIGREAIKQQDEALLNMANGLRFGPGFVMILAGLLLLALGIILAASAVWKSRIITKWSGFPLALGFLLYIPQFVAAQPIRVAHGLLVAVGCLWMALEMWRGIHKERS